MGTRMSADNPQILIVDDEPITRILLHSILDDRGYEVHEAETGREGIERAKEILPDLIILDILLPDLNGFEVCRQLKSNDRTCNIPVIFVTAMDRQEDELQGLNAGGIDYLAKPIRPQIVSTRVANALEIKFSRERLELQASELQTLNTLLEQTIGLKEQATQVLQQRDRILRSVNYAAEVFLRNLDWEPVVEDVLMHLGKTMEADHAWFISLVDEQCCGGRHNWLHENSRVLTPSLDLLKDWQEGREQLADGNVLMSSEAELTDNVRFSLVTSGIGSFVILPVFAGTTWWGCLGFDFSGEELHWPGPVISALSIAAETMGASLLRCRVNRERERLASVIHQFSDAVLMVDNNGIVFYANPVSRKITGYRPEELVGEPIQAVQRDERQHEQMDDIMSRVCGGETYRGAMQNTRKDGSLYDEDVLILPIKDEKEQVTGVVVIKHDVTEQKRLESIAEAANLMDNVGFVFSGIRHELGNPLNSLKMALSVLDRQLERFSPDQVREFIDRSLHEIERMEYLLYSLKNFNIYEEQSLREIELHMFLENFTRMHSQDLQRKNIKLCCRPPECEQPGLIDERAFHQVLLNLLTNAVLALEEKQEDGVIEISCLQTRRGFIQVRMEDNGCGISSEAAGKLFTPFYTTRAKGTGLGLSIVQKMLTAMNCTIEIEGEQGVGTTVTISVPLAGFKNQIVQHAAT